MPPKRQKKTVTSSGQKRQRKFEELRHSYPAFQDALGTGAVSKNPNACFLGIPRELRDLIYHEIWKTKKPFKVGLPQRNDFRIFEVQYSADIVEPREDALTPTVQRSPWILASKQVLEEAIQQFQREASWTYMNRPSFNTDVRQIGGWSSSITRRPANRRSPILLTIDTVPIIKFPQSLLMGAYGEMDNRETPIYRIQFYSDTRHLLQSLFASVSRTASLRSLSLVVEGKFGRVEDDRNVKVYSDLPSCDLPNLQTLEVLVLFREEVSEGTHFMSKLKESISGMGLAMMGGNGTIQFKKILVPIPQTESQFPPRPWFDWKFEFKRV
ncbi:hypothetical protein P153DRAFT_353358 [Dothidotthia symphoricarpi CBS 119687]|uniref:Uncharacterized protein n=1 Tax=Dothidotthia symphoricarpi CBS 119687 TaxID=1392245 RepID=A0A6A6AQG1_9PLEO|nr:uncharacterized protein P153DRAFT_353358 [Dothidotthia symphoricarpi CBS 119687]KAF2134169.1 hypothetical protein P153DRAFT_353358 [Dothidotthia symphoricarpi CBS 119687]